MGRFIGFPSSVKDFHPALLHAEVVVVGKGKSPFPRRARLEGDILETGGEKLVQPLPFRDPEEVVGPSAKGFADGLEVHLSGRYESDPLLREGVSELLQGLQASLLIGIEQDEEGTVFLDEASRLGKVGSMKSLPIGGEGTEG